MERGDWAAAQAAFMESIKRNVIKNPADSADAFWAWVGMAGVCAKLGQHAEVEIILKRLRERFVDHDFSIMFENAEISFAPRLQRLKLVTATDTLQATHDLEELPQPGGLSSLRDLFRRRASVEGPH